MTTDRNIIDYCFEKKKKKLCYAEIKKFEQR